MMKRRLQALALCAAALFAVRLMAQDAGGDASGAAGGADNSGGASDSTTAQPASGNTNQNGGTGSQNGGSGQQNGNTGTQYGTGGQNGGSGDQNGTQNGNGTGGSQNGGMGNLFGPGTGNPNGGTGGQNGNGNVNGTGGDSVFGPLPGSGTGIDTGNGTEGGANGGSMLLPALSPAVPVPGFSAVIPGATPAAAASPASSILAGGGTEGAAQTAPITFSLPGGYGGTPGQSFTLGQGRLSKPPITFTASVSQGFDDNVFDAPSSYKATPTPTPGPTPPLEARLLTFRIAPPFPPTPVYQFFRATPTPTPKAVKPLGMIGSPVTTLSLGVQVQKGTPRTVLTLDASGGIQEYWNEPGDKTDYTGSMDAALIHRLTPRASVSLSFYATYQDTPNFALVNAPTSGQSSGEYLDGDFKIDLSYAWTKRISTVTSYDVNFDIGATSTTNNVYIQTYGTQFRYTVSARNTITAELRAASATYPQDAPANSSSLYYLLGLDTFISAKLHNTVSGGFQTTSYESGPSQITPYIESSTILSLPRGASLEWTNSYGAQPSGGQGGVENISYRTGLSLTEPLSTKLVASLSLAYNYILNTAPMNSAASYTQNQLQTSASLGYTISPRLSLSLSYTYIDLLSTQINASYTRDQIFLGGNYTFR